MAPAHDPVSPAGSIELSGTGTGVRLVEGVCDAVQQLERLRHQPMGQVKNFEHAHEHHDAIAHGVDVKKPAARRAWRGLVGER